MIILREEQMTCWFAYDNYFREKYCNFSVVQQKSGFSLEKIHKCSLSKRYKALLIGFLLVLYFLAKSASVSFSFP